MSVDGVLAAGRAASEARMRDTVQLYSQDPDTFNRDTGTTTPGDKTLIYEGMARVKPVAQASGENVRAGERNLRLLEYVVELPARIPLDTGARVLPGMKVEVLGSLDVRMAGLVLWVTGAQYGDQVTAWRILTEDRS